MRDPQVVARQAGKAKKSRAGSRSLIVAALLTAGLLMPLLTPACALAHSGPANPVASSYAARIAVTPPGLHARILGGDLRMWLRVSPSVTVVVLDSHGAPYLRFGPGGVSVNTNSWMFYLNQPVPVTPPASLSPHLRAHWTRVSSGREYSWHDGRLHALAVVAVAPGRSYVGAWRIPLLVNGRRLSITGGLWHFEDPSIVWFWPVAVILLCLWAVSRLGRRELDRLVGRVLGLAALGGIAILTVGHELYGEPFVTTGQEILLGLILSFVVATSAQLALREPGSLTLIVIAVAALWATVDFIPVLLHGDVLMVVPAFLARAAAVACLACGVGLILQLFAFRLVDLPEERGQPARPIPEHELEDVEAWESLA